MENKKKFETLTYEINSSMSKYVTEYSRFKITDKLAKDLKIITQNAESYNLIKEKAIA